MEGADMEILVSIWKDSLETGKVCQQNIT